MKKITEKSTKAFINGKSFNEGNTEVKRLDSGDLEFNLFGNRIALLTIFLSYNKTNDTKNGNNPNCWRCC